MSTTATEAPRRNGVDVATLFATLDLANPTPVMINVVTGK
jgi:alkanesulfonate monooxygenase SsuD/methylene tetrahydromethanopterin reductase-like flavin-dependent oxidoreductase (luciferase family)